MVVVVAASLEAVDTVVAAAIVAVAKCTPLSAPAAARTLRFPLCPVAPDPSTAEIASPSSRVAAVEEAVDALVVAEAVAADATATKL